MNFTEEYNNPSPESIKKLIETLKSIVGKPFNINRIYNLIFNKKNWNEKEHINFQKANILAACEYLTYLGKQGVNENYAQNVRTCLAGLNLILKEYLKDKYEECSTININYISSFSHFQMTKSLFENNSLPTKMDNRIHLDLPVLYLLRLSLEGRVHGFLGIDIIRIKNRPLDFSKILKITSKMKSISFNSEINWCNISIVNDWINHFMHRHLRPYPWTIFYAIKIISPLFEKGVFRFSDGMTHSIYASTQIQNRESLKNELIEIVKTDYNADPFIIWALNHEVLIRK